MQKKTTAVVFFFCHPFISVTFKTTPQCFVTTTVLPQQFGCMVMNIMICTGDSTVSRGHKQFSYHSQLVHAAQQERD